MDLEARNELTVKNLESEVEKKSEMISSFNADHLGLKKEKEKMEELPKNQETTIKRLEEDIESRKEKEKSLQESINFSRNENAKLKSEIKLARQEEKSADIARKNQEPQQ